MRLRILMLGLAALLAVCGCGGRSGEERGRAAFTVRWPEPSRVIPSAALSIKIALRNETGFSASRVVPRPAQGGQVTETFFDLPVGPMTAEATAYSNNDGTGQVLASGSVVFNVLPNEVVTVSLTMASAIASIEISPENPTVTAGGTITLNATARNSAGDVLLITPGQLTWQSLDETRATVDGSGRVTGVAPGTVTIRVTDTESGRSDTVSLQVLGVGGAGRGLANSPWPKWARDLGNTALGIGSGATPNIRWTFDAPPAFSTSPVIGPDDTVYFASSDGRLYALDGATGAQKWSYSTGSPLYYSPLVQASGLILFGNRAGTAYAIDSANGTLRWQQNLSSGDASVSTIAPDGTAVFTSSGHITALDAETGQVRWTRGEVIRPSPTMALGADGALYVGAVSADRSSPGNLILDVATGEKKRPYGGGLDVVAGFAIEFDGRVLHSQDSALRRIDEANHLIQRSGPERFGRNLAIGPDGTIYAGTESAPFHAVYEMHLWAYRNGIRWSRDGLYWYPVVDSAGTVYAGHYAFGGPVNKPYLTALNGANGLTLLQMPISVAWTPAIGRDGTIYFADADNPRLVAVR